VNNTQTTRGSIDAGNYLVILVGSFYCFSTIFDANLGGVLRDTIDDIYCASRIIITFVNIDLLAILNQRNSLECKRLRVIFSMIRIEVLIMEKRGLE
jgi:hypothetical protein